MPRRSVRRLTTVALALPTALLPAAGASAAPPPDKAQVLSSWTQTSANSYRAWYAARQNQAAWRAYAFDWSTDYCSGSPDNPLGFPFTYACARHDFGYRNYKKAGTFPAAKQRLDNAFHADMKRVCAAYSGTNRSSCDRTAWLYYQAVVLFGGSAAPGAPARA